MSNPKFVKNSAMGTVLGAIFAIVANLSYIGDPSLAREYSSVGLTTNLLEAAGYVLIMTGLFGLWRSGALVQESSMAKTGFGMSVFGQLLAIVNAVIRNDVLSIATAVFLGIGMIILGLAVIQADTWQSWRKYIPVFYGIFPFSAIFLYPVAASLVPNAPDYVLAVMTIAVWLMFGIALWTEGGQLKSASPDPQTS